jgi:hypothetical protein
MKEVNKNTELKYVMVITIVMLFGNIIKFIIFVLLLITVGCMKRNLTTNFEFTTEL